ncbi:hypothetical protein IAT38_002489 [Cryptococcus sp. DSM 104549]
MNPRSLTTPLRAFTRTVALRPLASAAAPSAARRFPAPALARPYSDKAAEGEAAFHEKEDKRIADLEAAKTEAETKAKEMEEQVKDLKKDIQYLRADVQTAVRRTQEEKAKASEFAITSFARALLSTADVLATALKHVPQPIAPDNVHLVSLHKGVELTHKALLQTFEQHGVKPVKDIKGETFDPNLHEAVFQIPKEMAPKKADGGAHEPGQIVDVSKEGWMIGNRVLRPAQVGVVQME